MKLRGQRTKISSCHWRRNLILNLCLTFHQYIHNTEISAFELRVMTCSYAAQLLVTISFQAVPYNGLLFWCGEDFVVGLDPYNSGCCRCFQMPLEWNPSFGLHALRLCNGALRLSQLSYFTYGNFYYDVLSVWDLNDCDEDEGGEGGKWCLEHQLCINQIVSEKSP
uniref:F-box protein n=1 Tax=Quercus lobata TaxID=97700 RepID=A0A7N2R490_QUELO